MMVASGHRCFHQEGPIPYCRGHEMVEETVGDGGKNGTM